MSAVGFKTRVTASQLIKHQNQINKVVYRGNIRSQKSKNTQVTTSLPLKYNYHYHYTKGYGKTEL